MTYPRKLMSVRIVPINDEEKKVSLEKLRVKRRKNIDKVAKKLKVPQNTAMNILLSNTLSKIL